MSATPQRVSAEERLSIRANEEQKRQLRRAAELRHMNVSQFVLQTSLQEAERLIREETTLSVSHLDYEWIVSLLDEPTSDMARLREAMAKASAWDE